MYNLVGPEKIGPKNTIFDIVKKLAPQVPEGAEEVVVILHTTQLEDYLNHFNKEFDTDIRLELKVNVGNHSLKLRFDPPSETFPEGNVCVGYALGKLE